jgi:hypothetical protein
MAHKYIFEKTGDGWLLTHIHNEKQEQILIRDEPLAFLRSAKDLQNGIMLQRTVSENYVHVEFLEVEIVSREPLYKDMPAEKQAQKLVLKGSLAEVLQFKPSYVERLKDNMWFVVLPVQEGLKAPKGYPKLKPRQVCARCFNDLPNSEKELYIASDKKGSCDICGLHDVGLFVLNEANES